jgi:Bardet-Biedl syndrome 1 protein
MAKTELPRDGWKANTLSHDPPTQRLSQSLAMAVESAKTKGGITWLNAWEDPVANLPIMSPRMCLADVTGSGEVDFLAADSANRIRVYRGTNLVSETLLLGAPSAILPIYLDEKQPIIPAIAVAVGPTLYIYKKLRPFRKYVDGSFRTQKL